MAVLVIRALSLHEPVVLSANWEMIGAVSARVRTPHLAAGWIHDQLWSEIGQATVVMRPH